MRTITPTERTTAAAARVNHTLKVEIQDGDGTWKDWSAYLHLEDAAKWSETVDRPVMQGTLNLRRQLGAGNSLAPFVQGSALNVYAGGYAPAIDIGRGLRISTATHAPGAVLTGASYRQVVFGRVDKVAWQSDPIAVDFSSLDGWLMDTQIEYVRSYGSDAGTPIETVLQSITDDSPSGKVSPLLNVPVSPGYNLVPFDQDRTKVLDALRTLALKLGWDIRYRYSASDQYLLTFLNPDRTRSTVDFTLGPGEYTDVTKLELALDNIRNAGAVVYHDANGKPHTVPYADPASINRYGRRYFELPGTDGVDTEAEATTLVTAVVNDLSGPLAEQEITCHYLWFVQMFDRCTLLANGDHYDEDQTGAIAGYEHAFANGSGVTTLTLADRVVGAYAKWLQVISAGLPSVTGEILNLNRTDTDTNATWTWARGKGVDSVWAAYLVVNSPESSVDWSALAAAVVPLADDVDTFTAPRPADGQITLVQIEPRHADASEGGVRRATVTATHQVPAWEFDDVETTILGTQFFKITERGLNVIAVQVQTQIGTSPVSGWTAPTRGPGAASSVRPLVNGGILQAGEYEHDVTLDASRNSYITPRALLDNGLYDTQGPFVFDRDKNPQLISVVPAASPTILLITGDSDTKSIKVADKNGTWEYFVDGSFAQIDVSAVGTNGVAGLTSAQIKTYRVTAYAAPRSVVGVGTPTDTFDIQVKGASATVLSSWADLFVTAPTVGSNVVTIQLRASANPGTTPPYSVKVYFGASKIATNADPSINVTASCSPVPTTPPTSLTSYTLHVGYVASSTFSDPIVRVKIRADLIDDLGTVIDTITDECGYPTSS